jgi:peptide/nickel transport system ATP-binding protein/oligopeptide transport system ATP-binding protein
MAASDPLLSIRNLTVEFSTPRGALLANNRVSLEVGSGETLGIVGESGSGKSVLCRAVLRLLPSPPARVEADAILFEGRDLAKLSNADMRAVRGNDIAMVFQNPMSSLNPVWPVGEQVSEALRLHRGMGQREARRAAVALLKRVGIPSPDIRVDDYPYQWSGGMMQRAVIAMAMAGGPKLLLADEPTTALDVTIQDQILSLLMELQRDTAMAIMLVSHDMSVIAETCDRVAVMYAGYVVELASTRRLFEAPRHPYTHGLLSSIPRVRSRAERLPSISGQPPDLARLGGGCPFVERCPVGSAECRTRPIALSPCGEGHATACLFPERMAELDRKLAS